MGGAGRRYVGSGREVGGPTMSLFRESATIRLLEE